MPTVISANTPASSVQPTVNIDIQFRNCSIGEIYDPDFGLCKECKAGTYIASLEPNYQGQCINCDQNTEVCLGGYNFGPQNGFWRLNVNSTLIFSCPNSDACLANNMVRFLDSRKVLKFLEKLNKTYHNKMLKQFKMYSNIYSYCPQISF